MIKVAIQAAQEAGKHLRERFLEKGFMAYQYKTPHDIVTQVDSAAEAMVLGILKENFPGHKFFSEESGFTDSQSPFYWVIDPLDGTTNFSRNIPHFNVSIALLENNQPKLAVVYAPMADELFYAEVGMGAYLNGEHIKVSDAKKIAKSFAVIARGSGKEAKETFGSLFPKLTSTARSSRMLGAAALDLCYTACGRFDGYINPGCRFYDSAAGTIIAKEAGATVVDFEGQPFSWEKEVSDLLVTNETLVPQFLELVK